MDYEDEGNIIGQEIIEECLQIATEYVRGTITEQCARAHLAVLDEYNLDYWVELVKGNEDEHE